MNLIKTKRRYNVNHLELNTNLCLKEVLFLGFLQDIATDNAEENGFGYTWSEKNNFGWYLLKYRIELEKYPKGCGYIEIETECRGYQKLFTYRDFTIYSSNGEKIGRVSSCWALVGLKDKAMLPFAQYAADVIPPHEKMEDDLKFNKIEKVENFDYEKTYDVRFDELDTNHHANNTVYLSWALETLPYEFRKNNIIKNMDIQFKKDISIGETVLSKVAIGLNRTIHSIYNLKTNEELALLSIDWADIND